MRTSRTISTFRWFLISVFCLSSYILTGIYTQYYAETDSFLVDRIFRALLMLFASKCHSGGVTL